MLEFSDAQLQLLDELEGAEFVNLVHRGILEDVPDLASDERLRGRLGVAYAHAKTLGFLDSDILVRFLNTEALAPEFYRQPPIDAWLRKPGQKVEQRFVDLLSTVQSLSRREEN